MNAKKKQLVLSLGIGLICALLGTFLVSKYTGQLSTQFSSAAQGLQKQLEEKTKTATQLEKQLKSVQSAYAQLSKQLGGKPIEKSIVRDPRLRYMTVAVDTDQGWNSRMIQGSRVDVACSLKVREKNLTSVVLKNVLIAEREKPGSSPSGKLLAQLALLPDEAALLINAMNSCKLYFIEASTQPVSYTPVADLRHFKPAPPQRPAMVLPPPAPVVPPPETQKLTVIKGASQETLEFQR